MFFRIGAALLGAMTLGFLPVAQAVADIKVTMQDIIITSYAGAKVVGQARSDANGQFVFKDLAPGAYTIKIDGPSLMTAVAKSQQSTRSQSPSPNLGRAATGTPPILGDVSGDGKTTVVVSMGLLLPAVQRAREAATRVAPQSFRQPATARGVDITFTVPASAGATSSWHGTIGREP